MTHIVIAKIQSMQQNLTVSENEIAQYVINNSDSVVTSTITAMAKNTGTSEASINRFCKKIGFKGFNSFKIALAQENFYNSMTESRSKVDKDSLVSSVTHDYQQMLVNTSALLDENIVNQAACSMNCAQTIYIFSMQRNALVAHELEFKLNMTGIQARAVVDLSTMRAFANNITKNDLVIIIAHTIMNRDLYQTLVQCKEKNATIITITSYDNPKLAGLSDFKFLISDKITTKHSVSLSNNLVFLYVIDVLYCSLLTQNKSRKEHRLNNNIALDNYSTSSDLYYNL